MTPEQGSKILMDANTEDYNVMREMISEIERKLIGVDPIRQKQFYLPLQRMIFEAWSDACNPNDSFLFPKQEDDENKI